MSKRTNPHHSRSPSATNFLVAGAIVLATTGCSLKSGKQHRIQVSFPPRAEKVDLFQKFSGPSATQSLTSTATLPETLDDFTCFGMNVVGEGIAANSAVDNCIEEGMPAPGILGGLAPIEGGTIELLVPAGPGRTFQLYALQSSVGCTAAAEALNRSIEDSASGIGMPFEVGRATIDISGDTSLSIRAAFDPNHLKPWFCPSKAPSVAMSSIVLSKSTVLADGSDSAGVLVTLRDRNNLPIVGVVPILAATDTGSGNSYGACTATTATGLSTCSISSTYAEAKQIWVDYPSGIETLVENITFIAGAIDATESTLVASAPSVPADGSTPVTVTATVRDSGGNLVSGATVTLSSSLALGSGTITPASYVTGVAGTAVFTVTSSQGGTTTFSAVATQGQSVTLASTPTVNFTDSTPPTINLGTPSVGSVNLSGTVDFTVTYSGADTVTLATGDVTLATTGDAACSKAILGSGLVSRTIRLTSCTGNGTVIVSVAAGTASDLATNQAGTAGPSATVSVANSAATVAILVPTAGANINQASNSPTYTVSGACNDAGAAIQVKVDGANAAGIGTATCSGSAWSTTIDTSVIAQGSRSLTAVTTGGLGSATSAAVAVNKDTIAPVATVTNPATSTFITVALNTASFAVSGACDDSGATVQTKVDGANSGVSVLCVGAVWSATIDTTGLSEGTHVIAAQITDTVGNSAVSANVTVNKDSVAPTASISAPSVGAVSSATSVYFDVTYAGTSTISLTPGYITVNLTGSAACPTPGVSPQSASVQRVTFTGCTGNGSVGISILTGSGADTAGNPAGGAGPSSTATVNNTAPVVAITTPTNGSYVSVATDSSSYAVSGTCADPSVMVQVRVDAINNGVPVSCSGTVWNALINTQAVGEGAHSLDAVATDSLMNTTTSSSISWTKDTTVPTVSVSVPSVGAVSAAQTVYVDVTYVGVSTLGLVPAGVTVSGPVSCTVTIVNQSPTVDRVVLSSCSGNGSSTISIAPGSATDLAGNPAPSAGPSASFIVDNGAPNVAISLPTPGMIVTTMTDSASFPVSGTCDETGANMQVKVDGVYASPVVPCGGASWSTSIDTTTLAEGSHILATIATDVLGNFTSSASVTITKDTLVDDSASTVAVAPASQTVGTSATVTVTLTTTALTPVSGKTVTLTSSRGVSDSITPPSGVTGPSGTVTFSVVSTVTGTATLTADDTTDSIPLLATPTLTFNPGSPSATTSTLATTQSNIQINDTATVTLTARDTYGNAITAGGATVTFGYSGGTFGSTTDVGNGTYTATLTAGSVPAGPYPLGAMINSNPVTGGPNITVFNPGIDLMVPIELVDVSIGSDTTPITYEKTRVPLNTADYNGTSVTYGFEIVATNADSASRTAYLVDSSDTVKATLNISPVTTNPTRLFTTFTPTAGANSYRVKLDATNGYGQFGVRTARILIKQVAATLSRIYVPLTSGDANNPYVGEIGASGAVDYTTSTTGVQGTPDNYSVWKKPSVGQLATIAAGNSWTFEGVLAASSVGQASMQLWNTDASCSPTGSVPVSANSPTAASISFANGAACFGNGDQYQVRISTNNGSYPAFLYRAGLWVTLTNLSRAEIHHRVSRSVITSSASTNPMQRFLIDLASYSNPAVFFEAIASVPTGSSAMNAALCTDGSNDFGFSCTSGIGGGTLIFNDTANSSTTVQRTGGLSITSGDRYLQDFSVQAGSPTIHLNSSFIVIDAQQ